MRYGWMVYNLNDSFIGKSISHYGEWSQIEVEFFKTVLSPKDTQLVAIKNPITIGKNLVPIDMLRLKLSFFGALKFDPRSDKWLRICMFQGAPLPNELKNYDEQWVYRNNF